MNWYDLYSFKYNMFQGQRNAQNWLILWNYNVCVYGAHLYIIIVCISYRWYLFIYWLKFVAWVFETELIDIKELKFFKVRMRMFPPN